MRFLIPLVLGVFFLNQQTLAQIPVEVLLGDKKASFDLMFFKFFKQHEGQNSRFLFFSRERATVDYHQTSTAFLPQFGFTEAVSYNHPSLKGVAPVLVGQILNRGTFAKSGLQYARIAKDFTLFSWVVTELNKAPNVDLFVMARFTPLLKRKLRWYFQIESFNVFPTASGKLFSFTQRLRLGLKMEYWQFGAGTDFTENGRNADYLGVQNSGFFIRHEF